MNQSSDTDNTTTSPTGSSGYGHGGGGGGGTGWDEPNAGRQSRLEAFPANQRAQKRDAPW